MSAPDFGSWLAEIERQVEASAKSAAPPRGPTARAAAAAFDRWWSAENDKPFDALGERELALAGDASQRLASLSGERKRLDERLLALERENAALREAQTRLGESLTDSQTRASREREALEGRVAALQAEANALSQENARLEASRLDLQKAVAQAQLESKRLTEDLSLAAQRASAAEREGLESRRRTGELEARVSALREERAARDGALEELRRQVSAYQQRLVEAKESTDADVVLLRQETTMFLEEFRLIAGTLRKERA